MATTEINDLPMEMLVMILEKLSLHDLMDNFSKTCLQWRGAILPPGKFDPGQWPPGCNTIAMR